MIHLPRCPRVAPGVLITDRAIWGLVRLVLGKNAKLQLKVGVVKTASKFCSRVRKESVSSMGRLPCLGVLLRPQRPRQVAKKSRGSRPDSLLSHPSPNLRNKNLVPVSQFLGHSANGPGVKIPLGGSTAKECASRKSPALTAVSQLD